MPERRGRSLAPLMDERRYVESAVAVHQMKAHPDFRLCVTMNQDASVYQLPGLHPEPAQAADRHRHTALDSAGTILRLKCPGVDERLLEDVFTLLKYGSSGPARQHARHALARPIRAETEASRRGHAARRAAEQVLEDAVPSATPHRRRRSSRRSAISRAYRRITTTRSSAGSSTSSSLRQGPRWSRWNCLRRSGRRSNGPRAAGRRLWRPSSAGEGPRWGW